MRLARFDGDRLGRLDGDQVVDVSDAVIPHPDGGRLHGWITSVAAGTTPSSLAAADGPRRRLADTQLTCPLPAPPKIIAAPVNYLDHKQEMRVEHTVANLGIFLKARTSVIGPGDTVMLPYTDQRFDQEGELGVVIGRRARNVPVESAMDAVFGYTCLLDMSLRSTEDRSTRKSFDTFTPIGPWVVTADEIPDPAALGLRCWVNQTLRQDCSVADLVFDVPTLVAYASSVMTLEPGDVLATGTPQGVGPVADGDHITLEIDRVGRLDVAVSSRDAIPYAARVGAASTGPRGGSNG
ncbi:fumarylacetoacetate hydrolase family protein [Phytoactinopolyspora limicola]|uniref:fumarylacetoacetate hydrolase family protein n=1 Tax=Phytoactinopolyspora limicola TaxID=2715536 RepID=UPI001409C957|nr:fumarylacetoacetate hydrolase family protein [Phytoactinopolyspora limicola]